MQLAAFRKTYTQNSNGRICCFYFFLDLFSMFSLLIVFFEIALSLNVRYDPVSIP